MPGRSNERALHHQGIAGPFYGRAEIAISERTLDALGRGDEIDVGGRVRGVNPGDLPERDVVNRPLVEEGRGAGGEF